MFFRRAFLPVWKLTGFTPESCRPSLGFQTSLTWTSIRPHLRFNQALFARQSGTSFQRVCNLLKIRIPTTCFCGHESPSASAFHGLSAESFFYLHRQPSFLPTENCGRQKSYDRTRPGEESSHHSSPGLPYIIRCQRISAATVPGSAWPSPCAAGTAECRSCRRFRWSALCLLSVPCRH